MSGHFCKIYSLLSKFIKRNTRELINYTFILESLAGETLDLSSKGLKKLARCPSDADINTLIADDNELQRLDNLDSYQRITKVQKFVIFLNFLVSY